MDKQHYKKLSVDFPIEEYVFLKMACAKQNVSIKEFVNQAVMKSIEEYEDELDLKALEQITEEDRRSAQPWSEVKKELGWDKI